MLYTTNGMLEIDNNLVENAIRPVAVGRKPGGAAALAKSAARGPPIMVATIIH